MCVPLNMSHAVHSGLMGTIREEFEKSIRGFRLNKPKIPYISNVTALWTTGEEAVNPHYWGEHLCSTVRFSDGLKELLKEEDAIFVEIGPGRILGMMVRVHPDKKSGHIILNTVKHPQEKISDDYFLLDKVGQLWLHGQGIDWAGFYGKEKRSRISLPGYPFEGKRYWIDVNACAFKPGDAVDGVPLIYRTSEAVPGPGASTGTTAHPGEPGRGDENYTAPRDESEQVIARMWQELMGIERVGIHDDFFHLNGSSLVATQIMARLMEEYQVGIPINRFYEEPTIAHLAKVIKELQAEK
jgi:acyl transferase domain-containing protein